MRYFEKRSDFFEDRENDWNYLNDVIKHKYYVYKGARELDVPFFQALGHDMDKLKPSMFVPYRDFFYNKAGVTGKNDPKIRAAFKAAADKHRPNNPHHYFTTRIPEHNTLNNKLEAIADWYSADRRAEGYPENFPSFRDWWNQNKQFYYDRIGKDFATTVDVKLNFNKD